MGLHFVSRAACALCLDAVGLACSSIRTDTRRERSAVVSCSPCICVDFGNPVKVCAASCALTCCNAEAEHIRAPRHAGKLFWRSIANARSQWHKVLYFLMWGCAPDAQAERVNERLRDKKMRMELTDAAADYLAVRGFPTVCVRL